MPLGNRISKIIIFTATALPNVVFAQGGLAPVAPFSGTAQGGLISAITTIVNIFLILAALIASVFLVLGGVRYITSSGAEEAATKAKDTILYAIIGLVVIGLSAALVNFVIGAVSSA